MKNVILFGFLSLPLLSACGPKEDADNQISNTINPIPMLIQLKVISQNPENTRNSGPIDGNWDRISTKCKDGINMTLPFKDGSISIENDSGKLILAHKNGMTAVLPATFAFPSYGTGGMSVTTCGIILVNSSSPFTAPTIKTTRFTYHRNGTQLEVKFESDMFCNKNSNGIPGPSEAIFTQVKYSK